MKMECFRFRKITFYNYLLVLLVFFYFEKSVGDDVVLRKDNLTIVLTDKTAFERKNGVYSVGQGMVDLVVTREESDNPPLVMYVISCLGEISRGGFYLEAAKKVAFESAGISSWPDLKKEDMWEVYPGLGEKGEMLLDCYIAKPDDNSAIVKAFESQGGSNIYMGFANTAPRAFAGGICEDIKKGGRYEMILKKATSFAGKKGLKKCNIITPLLNATSFCGYVEEAEDGFVEDVKALELGMPVTMYLSLYSLEGDVKSRLSAVLKEHGYNE